MRKNNGAGKIIVTTIITTLLGSMGAPLALHYFFAEPTEDIPDRKTAIAQYEYTHTDNTTFNDYISSKYGEDITDNHLATPSPEVDTSIDTIWDYIEQKDPIPSDNTTFVPVNIIESITTAVEATEQPTILPKPSPTPHYNTSDFSTHEQRVINNSKVDFSKKQSVIFDTYMPVAYRDMAEKFVQIVESGKYSDGIYENFLVGNEVEELAGFTAWFEKAYGYEVCTILHRGNNHENDHADLDVKRMLKINSNVTPTQAQKDMLRLKNSIDNIIRQIGIEDGMSTDETLWRIHNYIIDNFDYDKSYSNYYAGQMLREGKGVCNAYVILFNSIAKACGIDCQMLLSSKDGQVEHVASLIKIPDGDEYIYYMVDTTMAESKDKKYMFGISLDDIIKLYSKKKGYNEFDILDYQDCPSYQSAFFKAISFTYDAHSGTYSSKLGTSYDISDMLNSLMDIHDDEMAK